MRTVVLGPPPAELQALIARRHSLGLDGFDEVWKGENDWPAAEQEPGWPRPDQPLNNLPPRGQRRPPNTDSLNRTAFVSYHRFNEIHAKHAGLA